jgi:hypothetical protein
MLTKLGLLAISFGFVINGIYSESLSKSHQSNVIKDTSDKRELLDDERINQEFASLVRKFLDTAKLCGFQPIIHEAYRDTLRAQQLNLRHQQGGPPAAKYSIHSYGIAVDIWLRNDSGIPTSYGDTPRKGNKISFRTWMKFIRIGQSMGLINAVKHNDSDHWEYHPAWNKANWVSAKKYAKPVYDKFPELSHTERLKKVWESAGLIP